MRPRFFLRYMNGLPCLSKFDQITLFANDVPQGSILSPRLFYFYINNLRSLFKFSKISLFTDDISLKITGKDLNEQCI